MPQKKRAAAPKKPVKKGARKKPAAKRKGGQTNAVWPYFVTLLMLTALFSGGFYAWGEAQNYRAFREMREAVGGSTFYEGATVDGTDVSGLTLEEALALFAEGERAYEDAVDVTLTSEDRSWHISAEDVGYRSNYISVVRHAYQAGRSGTLEERYAALGEAGDAYAISRGYDEDALRDIVEEVARSLSKDAVNASVKGFDVASRSFSFSKESEGARVDAQALFERVKQAFLSGEGAQTIRVKLERVEPTVTRASLEGRFGQITSAVTNASSSSSNRLTNISTALRAINGTRVDPGETFSFNATVGERTTARGYKSAGAFVDGLVSEEVGGGICQVSTTLFNAAAKADLTIVERSPHSRPVAYVDKGKDAAVDWGSKNLRFTNTSDYPIYLVTFLSDDKRVYAQVYGELLPDGMSVKVEAQTTATLSPGEDVVRVNTSLSAGERVVVEKARQGYRAVAYRVYYDKNDREIRREELCKSTYAASGAIIEVGR